MILNKSIHVFQTPDLDGSPNSSGTLIAVSSFALDFGTGIDSDSNFVEEASFEAGVPRNFRGSPLLLFAGRRRDFFSFTGALILDREEGGQPKARLVDVRTADYYRNGDEHISLFPKYPQALQSIMGHSFGYVLQIVESVADESPPLEIHVMSWSKQASANPADAHLSTFTSPSKLDGNDTPLLHFLTCLDFDDAAGLIALGTSRGDLCVVRYLPESCWAIGALTTYLPKLRNSEAIISKVRCSI